MTTPPHNAQKPRKKARRITPEYLHNASLYYLERYAASMGKMRSVLLMKVKRSCRDHPDQDEAALIPLVDAEIEKLARIEVLNDDRLGEALVSGYRARGMSARLISMRLKQKGFTASLIENLMRASQDDATRDTEKQAAIKYLMRRKLWPYLREPIEDKVLDNKARAKAWAALARQGYDPDLIQEAMKKEIV